MPGARLQNAGQIRLSYPWMVNGSTTTAPTQTAAALSSRLRLLPGTIQLPFDLGPDKSERFFLILDYIGVSVSADAYSPTPPLASAALYYQSSTGRKYYLDLVDMVLQNVTAIKQASVPMAIAEGFTGDTLDNLGYIGVDNIASSFGSATTLTFTVYNNIGVYGDYGEIDIQAALNDWAENMHTHAALVPVPATEPIRPINWRS